MDEGTKLSDLFTLDQEECRGSDAVMDVIARKPLLYLTLLISSALSLSPFVQVSLSARGVSEMNPLSVQLMGGASAPQLTEEIANPQVTSQEALQERIAAYSALLSQTHEGNGSTVTNHRKRPQLTTGRTRRLLERFLKFAAAGSGWALVVTDGLVVQVPQGLGPDLKREVLGRLGKAYAGMLARWRSTVKIDLPPGFLFVKLYGSREEMADEYALAPPTVGVAFPCRYIALSLPYQEDRFWGLSEPYFIGEEFQQTAAHEFVHAFCFMTLGYHRAASVPRWFMEGLALHLSGAHRVRTAIASPAGMKIRDFASTKEYEEFRRLIQFVEEKFGQGPLYSFVRMSLAQGSVDRALPRVLNLADEPALVGEAVSWVRGKNRFQQRVIFIVIFLLVATLPLLRGRTASLRWMVALLTLWIATLYASLTPYYVHTSLWWLPAALSLPLGYLTVRAVRHYRQTGAVAIRLNVVSDWPWVDEVMVPWPYEDVNLADIAQAAIDAGSVCGERSFSGSEASRLIAFLDGQYTESFYFQGRAYRVWYERGPTASDGKADL